MSNSVYATNEGDFSRELDVANTTIDTSFSSGAEISFGPQSVPFAVLGRQSVYHSGEHNHRDSHGSKASAGPKPASGLGSSGQRIILKENHNPEPKTQQSSPAKPTASQANIKSQSRSDVPMSKWRLEQIKYTKKGRLATDEVLFTITAFHGPLSLPYARNPR
jgi:hypothetical protein